MKLWNKGKELNSIIEEFTVGDDHIIDKEFLVYDCIASIAHAKTLERAHLLTKKETKELINELKNIQNKGIEITIKDEDCHTAIENHLVKKLGETGKKIHTGRSRNDQIMTAIQLWARDSLTDVHSLIKKLLNTINSFSKKNNVIMPGYTHMQKAMPSSVSLLTGSYIESFMDDIILIESACKINDRNPLGSAAGYGTTLPLNMNFTAKNLGFQKNKNFIYVQSRTKLISTMLYPLCSIAKTLDKIASDLMLFTMNELNFFSLPDEFTTGSSIMPQKKNYDVLELIRGRSSLIHGALYTVDMLGCKLISGYNRDYQLVKKPLIEAFMNTKNCLRVIDIVFKNLKLNKKSINNSITKELFAADTAYELVKKGLSFREAYKTIAKNPNMIKIPDNIYKNRDFLKPIDHSNKIRK